jgi:hypothetical protein
MKKKFLLSLIFALAIFSCNIADINFSANNSGKVKNNPKYQTALAFKNVNFLNYAQPLVFGPSVGDSGGGPNCSIVLGGYAGVPDDCVELRAISGAGKIAGSEDGIAFFYKEVDVSKNFSMEAEFLVVEYGNGVNLSTNPNGGGRTDTGLAADGQNGFGIMARDFIPQWPGATMKDVQDRRDRGILNLGLRDSVGYYTGNRGGDSNMIMVGGVKYGSPKIAWRYGIKWNNNPNLTDGVRTDLSSGNPTRNEYQDAGMSKFGFLPKELGDYSMYTNDGKIDGTPTVAARPDYPEWGKSRYRLKLEKNNNGFDWEYEFLPDETLPDWRTHPSNNKGALYRNEAGEDEIRKKESGTIPLYDILDSVNKEKYYVGFFTARNARVWISKIKYSEADVSECAPYIEPLPDEINPILEVVSPSYYTGADYIYAQSNVSGRIIVTQDGKQIPSSIINNEWIVEKTNASALPYSLFTIPTLPITKDGDTVFVLTFYPDKDLPKETIALSGDAGAVLKSYAPVKKTFILTKKLYNGGTEEIWVSPNGSPENNGSKASPLDLQTAINCVQPGQTVKLTNGTYIMDSLFAIPRYNNGRNEAVKTLIAETTDQVFLDWNKDKFLANRNQGFLLAGNYWVLDGFHIRNTPDKTKGMVISGNNNTIRRVQFYNNGDTGLQISGDAKEAKRFWPSNNLIEFCESFYNKDDAAKDADGFGSKLTVGRDNRFEWCISHNNVDDGWDCFTKKETGPIGVIKLYGCIAYESGIMLDGTAYGSSVGLATRNGFKMGGEGISVKHEIRECLSFGNDGNAITSNSNPSLYVFNSTAIGGINISAGDKSTPIDGKAADCITSGVVSDDLDSILVAREINGVSYKKFLRRDVNGKPVLNNVYKSGTSGKGAWVFYN